MDNGWRFEKGLKGGKAGGFDFRSDLKRGEDTRGKAQKGKGDRKTQIVDITGIDVLSSYAGLNTSTKKLSNSTNVFIKGKEVLEAFKTSIPGGWSLGQDTGEMINQETIEITNTYYSSTFNPATNKRFVTERVSVPKDTVVNTKDKSQVLLNQKRKNAERRKQEQKKLEQNN